MLVLVLLVPHLLVLVLHLVLALRPVLALHSVLVLHLVLVPHLLVLHLVVLALHPVLVSLSPRGDVGQRKRIRTSGNCLRKVSTRRIFTLTTALRPPFECVQAKSGRSFDTSS